MLVLSCAVALAGPARPVRSTTFPPPAFVQDGPPPDAVVLTWEALDAIDYQIQYCDTLSSNTWQMVPVGFGIPTMIPSSMGWIDDGTVITNLPVWQQPQRFYRLVEP